MKELIIKALCSYGKSRRNSGKTSVKLCVFRGEQYKDKTSHTYENE